MSKIYAIIIQFVLRPTTFYRSGVQRSDVYKRDVFVTSWRFQNRTWQPQRYDRLPETSGTLWIHRVALTNQRCSLAIGCGINPVNSLDRDCHSIAPVSVKLYRAYRYIDFRNRTVTPRHGNALCVTDPLWGKPQLVGGFPSQNVFFDVILNT